MKSSDDGGKSVESSPQPFPIVAIGASAGGLEAISQLLGNIPAQTGLAFLVVQHLHPGFPSALTEILGRTCKMPIQEVADEPVVQPNHVYVIPPNKQMFFENGNLHLAPREPKGFPNMPFDRLLSSLAASREHQSIAVVLSGTGSDGADGCRLIKQAGGITFAQAEGSAKYSGMPQGAVDAGCVDFVLSPPEIAAKLVQIASHPYIATGADTPRFDGYPESLMNKCLEVVSGTTGVDFSQYKATTLQRRIHRRMVLNKITDINDYLRYLKNSPGEAEELYRDVLITVTNFFREPEAFEVLKNRVFLPTLTEENRKAELRIWVPGCATGEEAYSIAMTVSEVLSTLPPSQPQVPVQLFGTDINEASLAKARLGLYSEAILKDVTPDRLHRFFAKKDGHYQIQKSIREMCIFARQNVTKDPPFSNLDLISCRNLLIYFGEALQTRVVPAFHYGLKPGGYLLLGGSETLGKFSDQFVVLDKKQKLYQKKANSPRLLAYFANVSLASPEPASPALPRPSGNAQPLERQFDRALLEVIAPASIVVTEQLDIVHLRGNTSDFLAPPSGQPSFNLNRMAREGLLMDIRSAIKEAKKSGRPATRKNLDVQTDHGRVRVDIDVHPFIAAASREQHYIIAFYETPSTTGKSPKRQSPQQISKVPARENQATREELRHSREEFKALVEEHEATLEEYRSANEEILSSNEELQSLNEEMETAKEELQSTNEELRTLNEELQTRNAELAAANDDLGNLFSNAGIALMMLTNELLIRRFTPQAQELLNLHEADVGRSIADIRINLRDIDIAEIASKVITSMVPHEQEIQAKDGAWYLMRARAFKTSGHLIAGAVVTFHDVDILKRTLEESRLYTSTLIESARESILILNSELRVVTANNSFYKTFFVEPAETENRFVYELGNGQWDIPQLRQLLEGILPTHSRVDNFEVNCTFPEIGKKIMALNARRIESPLGKESILLAIEDITVLRSSEEALRELSNRLMNIEDAQRRQIARDIHDVTGQKMAALRLNLALLAQQVVEGQRNPIFSEAMVLADQVIDEVRSLSYLLHPPMLDELGLVPALREYVEGVSERTGLQIGLDVPGSVPALADDVEITIFRIVQECLTNVHRHSGASQAAVRLVCRNGEVELRVSDSGRGFGEKGDPFLVGADKRLGVGLTGMKERVSHLGGTLSAENGTPGAIIVARIPADT